MVVLFHSPTQQRRLMFLQEWVKETTGQKVYQSNNPLFLSLNITLVLIIITCNSNSKDPYPCNTSWWSLLVLSISPRLNFFFEYLELEWHLVILISPYLKFRVTFNLLKAVMPCFLYSCFHWQHSGALDVVFYWESFQERSVWELDIHQHQMGSLP